MGMSLEVRSEGERVRGQRQLDSTQEETRLRKGGERATAWIQWDINIELMGGSKANAYSGGKTKL